MSVRHLHSDTSNFGSGALDITSGQCLHEFWRDQKDWHINVKELHAAIAAVEGLAKPGEKVHIAVDNTVAGSYLRRAGGKKGYLKEKVRPFCSGAWTKMLCCKLQLQQVASSEMLADSISRWQVDPGDYTLDREVFLEVQKIFAQKEICQAVDMFASPGNSQLQTLVCRWPHHQAVGCDALEMDLCDITSCYSNPPGL